MDAFPLDERDRAEIDAVHASKGETPGISVGTINHGAHRLDRPLGRILPAQDHPRNVTNVVHVRDEGVLDQEDALSGEGHGVQVNGLVDLISEVRPGVVQHPAVGEDDGDENPDLRAHHVGRFHWNLEILVDERTDLNES